VYDVVAALVTELGLQKENDNDDDVNANVDVNGDTDDCDDERFFAEIDGVALQSSRSDANTDNDNKDVDDDGDDGDDDDTVNGKWCVLPEWMAAVHARAAALEATRARRQQRLSDNAKDITVLWNRVRSAMPCDVISC
jgi:hypothetical protein